MPNSPDMFDSPVVASNEPSTKISKSSKRQYTRLKKKKLSSDSGKSVTYFFETYWSLIKFS